MQQQPSLQAYQLQHQQADSSCCCLKQGRRQEAAQQQQQQQQGVQQRLVLCKQLSQGCWKQQAQLEGRPALQAGA
jgi:hypothetical protein